MSEIELRDLIEDVAGRNGFKISANLEKIIKAKVRFFKEDELHRCPCDAKAEDRFCGSQRCLSETRENGKCHCNLFLYEKLEEVKVGNKTVYRVRGTTGEARMGKDLTTSDVKSLGYSDVEKEHWDSIFNK